MGSVTYQTIKLSKGKHRSPEDGACVIELTSMLAGEQFTDHPVSVCPVIAALLRSYNDSLDDRRRQNLYAYASRVVGSRSTVAVERARGDRLTAWTGNAVRRGVAGGSCRAAFARSHPIPRSTYSRRGRFRPYPLTMITRTPRCSHSLRNC